MTQAEKPQVAANASQDNFEKKNESVVNLALPDAPPPAGDDIPEDVKKQLIGYADIELERELYECLATFGTRHTTVDKLVLSLWARYKKVVARGKMIRMLNSMVQTGLIVKQDSPRGYRMPDPNHPSQAE